MASTTAAAGLRWPARLDPLRFHMMTETSHAPLMLSISGLRGISGESFTAPLARRYARAFAGWIRDERSAIGTGPEHPLLCIARDGRRGGAPFLDAVRDALLGEGCDVIDLGVAMTPTVGVAIGRHGADGGMVVTASHNPQEWNGLKALDADGLAPAPERAREIIARFHALREAKMPADAPRPGAPLGRLRHDPDAARAHVDRVLREVDAEAIRARAFRIVLDSVNASGCEAGRMLLERLGCTLTHLHGDGSGIFPHTPEPLEVNLGDLMRETPSQRAACGFAQDPDADRLAIVDEHGRYIGEEYTLVLASWRMLERHGPGVLATNLSTSRLIDRVAERFPGARVVRTPVGEAHVAAALRRERGLIGGEGNGGVILPRVTWVRDSLTAMALVLDLLASRPEPLSAIVGQLPRAAMVKTKVDLAGIGGAAAVTAALDRIRHAWPHGRVNDADGVRVDLPEGWVHLRPSNTEPIVRIIAEAADEAAARALVEECRLRAGLSGSA